MTTITRLERRTDCTALALTLVLLALIGSLAFVGAACFDDAPVSSVAQTEAALQ